MSEEMPDDGKEVESTEMVEAYKKYASAKQDVGNAQAIETCGQIQEFESKELAETPPDTDGKTKVNRRVPKHIIAM